jgi:hypothetical protein
VLDHLLAELARSMALCAVARLDESDDSLVAAAGIRICSERGSPVKRDEQGRLTGDEHLERQARMSTDASEAGRLCPPARCRSAHFRLAVAGCDGSVG